MELPIQNTPEVLRSADITQPQTSTITPKRPSKKFLIIIILIVVVVVGEILAYFLIVEPLLQKSAPASESPKTTTAPAISNTETSESTGVDYYIGGKSIVMNNIAGTDYSSTAYRSVMPGHIFWAVHANLPDPPEGTFYQIWIGIDDGDHFPTGILYEESEDKYAYLFGWEFDASNPYFKTELDLPNYILISLETVEDEIIEDIILKGIFVTK